MLIMIATDGPSTRAVYNSLREKHGEFPIIIEDKTSIKVLLRNRVKKLGWFRTASQLAFMIFNRFVLERVYNCRVREIIDQADLDLSPLPTRAVRRVSSVNSPEAIALIQGYDPKVVVVNGTRIISRAVLGSSPAVFINTHAGITPAYRGVHGGYWARYQGDLDRCGVTVHLVDSSVDTGPIVAQANIVPTGKDAFPTYPYLQIAAALPLLRSAIQDALDGTIQSRPSTGDSRQWYHPGIVEYLLGVCRNVR